ncbi:MAG: hypothetical protein U0990_12680 [Candidatus Nanopelagicales bacterium]|nr:hypothetical protein [Candidatus Nanopelagicales bacterium]
MGMQHLETLEVGTEVEEKVEEQPEGDAEQPKEDQEKDPKDLKIAALETELDRERKARRDERIALRSRKESEERQDLILQLVRDLKGKQDNGDMTEAEASKALQAGIADVEKRVTSSVDGEEVGETLKTMFQTLSAAKADPSMSTSEDLSHAIERYEDARTAYLGGNPALAKAYVEHADTALKLAQDRATPSNRRSAAGMSVNNGGAGGGGVTVSDQSWINRYADEENGGVPPTPENARRAAALNARGIYAKPLKR